MPRRRWDLLVRKRPRQVDLDHRLFSGRRRLTVDGVPVPVDPATEGRAFDTGSVHPFELDGVPCHVAILANRSGTYDYELVVDGRVHPTGALPRFPVPVAHPPFWAHAIDVAPRATALAFALSAALWFGFAMRLAWTLSQRPDAPSIVPLGASAVVGDDAWVDLVGLSIDCERAAFRHGSTGYRLAGRDERGRPVVVTDAGGRCVPDRARGTLRAARGTSADALARRFRSPSVRVLSTTGGPDDERVGLVVCGVLSLVSSIVAAFAWVRVPRSVPRDADGNRAVSGAG